MTTTPAKLVEAFTSEQARTKGSPIEKFLERVAWNKAIEEKKTKKATRKQLKKDSLLRERKANELL